MTTRTHFLVQMIHTKLLSNLAKLKIKPTVIATINMTELDLIELRRLYPNAWVKPYSRETKYDYDLLIIDPSNFDSTQLNEFLSLETQTLNEDRVIILSVFNHSSKEVMKKSNGNLFHQIVIDDRCILKSLKNLKKQNLFTFTSSELPMMRIGPNDEWIRCGIFIIAKNTIFPSKRNECSIKTFFYSMTSDEVEAIQEERFIEEMMEEQSQLKDYELKMKIYNKVHTKEILQYNHFNTFQNQR